MAAGAVTVNISKPSGKGLSFDGVNGNVDCGTSTSLNMTSELTIMGRYYQTDNTDDRHLARKDTQYALMQKNTNELQCYLHDGGWIGPFNSTCGYTVKTWTHWALVIRRISATKVNVAFFKNGVIDDLGEQACGALNTTANPFYLGSNAAANFFKGTQDNIKIFDKAISDADVLADYKKTLDTRNSLQQLIDKGLVAWYTFADTADQGHDDSDTGNDGTLAGGAASAGAHDTTEDDVRVTRVDANSQWGFIPLAGGRDVMTVHIEN